jgi:hypothetical protein
MQRRTVLAGVAGFTATTGCLSVPSADADNSHPFAGETVTVRVDQRTDSPHNLGEVTETVLLFWASNSERYTGFAVEFELVETGTPDVVLVYADGPEACSDVEGYSDRVLGCAPVLRPDTSVPEPSVARVVAERAARNRQHTHRDVPRARFAACGRGCGRDGTRSRVRPREPAMTVG